MMRQITGTGGPMILVGEGFAGPTHWSTFMQPGADRLGQDFHVYVRAASQTALTRPDGL